MIPIEHKRLLIGCESFNEFVLKYKNSPQFKDVDPMAFPSRVKNMWFNREKHIKEINLHDEAEERLRHTVMIPARIHSKATASSMKSDGDVNSASILNEIRYQSELLREQNTLLLKLVQKVYPDYISAIQAEEPKSHWPPKDNPKF